MEDDKDIELFVETLPNGGEILALRDKEVQRIYNVMNEDSEQAITDAKYGFITGALKETFTDNHMEKEQTTRVIDSIVTHRIWGYPIFFLFLYIMFEGTFVLGDYPMQGIEWLVDQLGNLIRNNMAEGPLKDMLVDGIIGGVGGVIVFLFVRYFGAKVVDIFIPHEKITQLKFLNTKKKLTLLTTVVFLIPGTPKDVLTYFVGLTPMKLTTWTRCCPR